jgi:hypothetical protein
LYEFSSLDHPCGVLPAFGISLSLDKCDEYIHTTTYLARFFSDQYLKNLEAAAIFWIEAFSEYPASPKGQASIQYR